MITPMQANIAESLDQIDQVLAETVKLRDEALPLMADNEWCVKALGRNGITVPGVVQ